jgi:hypothetical protein
VVAGATGDGQSNQLPWACLRWTKIAPARPAFVAVSMNRPPAIGASLVDATTLAPKSRLRTRDQQHRDPGAYSPSAKIKPSGGKDPCCARPSRDAIAMSSDQTGAEQPTESLMTSDCRVKPVTIAFAIQTTRRPPSLRRHCGRPDPTRLRRTELPVSPSRSRQTCRNGTTACHGRARRHDEFRTLASCANTSSLSMQRADSNVPLRTTNRGRADRLRRLR